MFKADSELSRKQKLRRSLYNTLRNELDYALIEYGLVDSHKNFLDADAEYEFVQMRELKPRGKVEEKENDLINGFIIIFAESAIPADLKKYVRYFDNNKVTKENLPEIVLSSPRVAPQLLKVQKYFEHERFYGLLKSLLPVDYALLIQQDETAKKRVRYYLSHFHVRIDWLIDFAAESLGRQLRYVSKDLYEKGEKYAEEMVERLFEYYSFHHTVSGRRTAAMVAYQLLSMGDSLATVYVNSSEARTLTKITAENASKHVLVKVPKAHVEMLEKDGLMNAREFKKNYVVSERDGEDVAVFRAVYERNEHSTPPSDGKLRELQPDVQWLRVAGQHLLPRPEAADACPISYSIIYDQQDPFSR
ncbi:MAG: hypothetical protein HY098_08065 [Nitrospinae bacterium]|nr:hypothetical protein [Nitrospinota bacterium]